MCVTGNPEDPDASISKNPDWYFFLECLSEEKLGKYFCKFYVLIFPL